MVIENYAGPVWKVKHREFHDELLNLLVSRDKLVVLKHGKPPYNVVFGVPHQAAVGETFICQEDKDRIKPKDADENAASYALVAFSILKAHDIPCKIVIAAHPTLKDPNKDKESAFCNELLKDTDFVIECHGAGKDRDHDLEISAGKNKITPVADLCNHLGANLASSCIVAIQEEPGSRAALVYEKDKPKRNGKLENAALFTPSLQCAEEKGIRALHIEAKPDFRKTADEKNSVTPLGFVLGRELARLVLSDWIAKELGKKWDNYLSESLNMVSGFNDERQRAKEYQGRQFLELLQNADDEAQATDYPSMLLRLENDRLIVANNGSFFSRQGIRSLMYPNTSPKATRRRKIGYKGLGFRAILNWTDAVRIKSGALAIEFARKHAIGFYKDLLKEEPSIAEKIKEVTTEDYPIPTLAIPQPWLDNDLGAYPYDTVIELQFSSEEVKRDIQRQIKDLDMHVALFLNNLRKITIESPERNEIIVRGKPVKDSGSFEEVQVLDHKNQVLKSRRWKIFPRVGDLPQELRKGDLVDQHEYELKIAVSENIDDDINSLFSYFQTEVKFPFPAIVHGTFDLEGNRKHINDSDVNRFLLKELADLMTDTARKITKSDENICWDAMKLLAKKGEFDYSIDKLDFYKNLISSIKAKKLIPVLSQKYMAAEEKPAFYDFPLSELLKTFASDFPDLATYTADKGISDLLQELGLKSYKPEELTKKLNKISPNLATDKRAELIILLLNNYEKCLTSIPPEKMPRLFIDEQGEIIGANTRALLPPEGTTFQLPDTVRLVFISTELSKILRVKAGVKRNRSLAEKLSKFKIAEYSAAAVISRIVATTNRAIPKMRSKEAELVQKMVQGLFTIYSDKTNTGLRFPERRTVRLFNTKGVLKPAGELYFGKEYTLGRIMEALYSPVDDTVFVAGKETLGLGNYPESEVITFLKWLGIEQFPRITLQKDLKGDNYDRNYEDYVLKSLLKTPYVTDRGERYLSFEDLQKHLGRYSTMKVADIENLGVILEKAKFEHVLAWLHHDPRIQGLFRDDHEPSTSSFNLDLSRSGARVDRIVNPNDMRSYIVYRLKTLAWIKIKSGQLAFPSQCCLSETLDGLSPIIELPLIDYKEPVLKTNHIDKRAAEHVLTQVGVSEDLSTLPTEIVYAILSSLENTDPDGQKAKRIYTGIMKNKTKEWDSTLQGNKAHDNFISKGTILSTSDGKTAYLPVTEVYYIENIKFREIIAKFPVAEIPRRLGKDRIRDVFGVSPLEDIQFALTSEPQFHTLNTDFSKHFEKFKPYVLAFRLDDKKFTTDLNSIKKLKICLCTQIQAKYSFDGNEEVLHLNPYEPIQPSGEDTTYMIVDPEGRYKDVADLKKDTRFCMEIADIFTYTLKVDKNREHYIILFPRDDKERAIIINEELDDSTGEKFNEVRRRFTDVADAQKQFWNAILASKDTEKDLSEIEGDEETIRFLTEKLRLEAQLARHTFSSLDYDDISSLKNLPLIRSLFDALEITVKDYNLHAIEDIDFNQPFRSEITIEKIRLVRKFQTFIYDVLKDKDNSDKERFTEILSAYQTRTLAETFDLNSNFDPDKAKCFDTAFQEEPFKNFGITYTALSKQVDRKIDEAFTKNRSIFLQKLNTSGGGYKDEIAIFLENAINKSLLYFAEYDELIKRFYAKYRKPEPDDTTEHGDGFTRKKKTININGKDEEYEDDNYEALLNNVNDDLKDTEYGISSHDPTKPEEASPTGHGGGGGGAGRPKPKTTVEVGFIGEAYVYGELVKKYGQDKVFWVSENAKKANINPQGTESTGYDMHYIDENDKLHYIEVKSSSSDDSAFNISPEEVTFGEKHRKEYEVIQVLNALDKESREIKSLGRIFDYAEDESFNNNTKFSVENDGYKIRYK